MLVVLSFHNPLGSWSRTFVRDDPPRRHYMSATTFPSTAAASNPTFSHYHENVEWIVRPATIDDAKQTAKLLSESFYKLLPQDYDGETLFKALPAITTPRRQLLTCGTWYVVEHPISKDIVGCGGWTLRSPAPNSTQTNLPNLRHFATHPDWTRRGIGKSLWSHTWANICNAVGEDTELEVFSTLTAEPFYASFGFIPFKRVEIPLAKDCLFPCIIMRRESQLS